MSDKIFTAAFWIDFWHETAREFIHGAVQVAGILIAYILIRTLLYRIIDGVLVRLIGHESRIVISDERAGRLQTLQGLSKSIIGYVLFFVVGIMVLGAVGIPILPFVTSASVIGIAVGLGAQKLFKDVISGFFIVVDNLYGVGETITVGTITGEVQELGMRVTRLVDASGKTHLISNGDIGTVTNLSRHPIVDFIEINVGPTADLNKVIEVTKRAGELLCPEADERVTPTNPHGLKSAPKVLGITAFTSTSVTVRVSVVTDPDRLLESQMQVRAALREAYLAEEIPIA